MTGSTTIGARSPAPSRSATAPMIGAVDSIPILIASAPKSLRTASSWRATNSGGRLWTPVTPTEFCAVTAVSTDMPNVRNAENVSRSAWIPAPPPESDPAIVSALATPIDGSEYTWRLGAVLLRRDHQRELAQDAGRPTPLWGGRRR